MGFRGKQGESCSSVGKTSRSRAPSIYVHAVYKSVYTEDLSPWAVSSARAGGLLFLRSQVTEGSDPTTVVSSRCPLVLTRSTQKPLSSLCKVTRSMTPEISSVAGRRSGIAGFMRCRGSFSHERLRAGDLSRSRSSGDLATGRGSGRLGRFGGYRSHEKAFWATLERHRRRETAPSLAKNTSVATQQGRAPNALATRFLLIAAGILAARMLWRMPE